MKAIPKTLISLAVTLLFESIASVQGASLDLQQARFEATSWKKYSKCPSALAEMRLLKTTAA
ncbi:MAG: hypothetical protein NTY38_28370, partial [Acidobacteria bacterium]|nr:hypothetical protein [Acidobacteriota bacterium]